jgi:PST family polysaccharide transporter
MNRRDPAASSQVQPGRFHDREAMDRMYAKGLVWTALSKWGVQAVSWTITLFVAHILVPSHYGIMGMARVFATIAVILSEAGLGAAVLRYQGLSLSELRQLNTLALLLGFAAAALSIALAGPMATFFASPALEAVLMVMSLSFVASGVKVVPYALLARDLAYRTLALVDGASAVVAGIVTLTLALSGATYWSLVIGALVQSVCLATLPLASRRIGVAMPDVRSIAEPLRYGYQIIRQRIFGHVYMSADVILIGRMLGEAPLGAYSLASYLAHAPEEKISDTASRVSNTVFAAVQDAPSEMARYYLRTTEALALITMPACIGLGLVAEDLVLGLLQENWIEMVLPLRILSVVAVIKALQPLGGMVGNLRGKERTLSRLNVGLAMTFPPIIYFSTEWGIAGVSLAWLVVFPVYASIRTVVGCRSIGVRLTEYLSVLVPAATGSVVMTIVVLAAQSAMPREQHILRLLLATSIGAIAYWSTLAVLHRERVRGIIRYVKALREGRPAPADKLADPAS